MANLDSDTAVRMARAARGSGGFNPLAMSLEGDQLSTELAAENARLAPRGLYKASSSGYAQRIPGGGGGATAAGGSRTAGLTNVSAGGGSAPITQGAYDRQEELRLQSQLQREEAMRREGVFRSLVGDVNASGAPTISRSTGASAAQETAARDAAFARAKEKAGMTARASLTALEDAAAGSGLSGSSLEAGRMGNIIGGAAGSLGEFLRDQAISEADRATNVADLEYTGGITQRGQDLSRKQALLGLLAGGRLY